MTRRLWWRIAAVLAAAAVAVAVVWATLLRPGPEPDLAALNDAVRTAEEAWPDLATDDFAAGVTIATADGEVLATTSDDPPATAQEAAGLRALSAPIVVDGQVVALAFVVDDLRAADSAARARAATVATVAIALLAALTVAVLVWVDRRVLRPFARLSTFAVDVAAGDLDAPLQMDRDNVFGAWSESFDLMRTELAASRQRELEARESKRVLVGQISHDVRTPIASIAATAELLRLRAPDPSFAERLDVILAKSAQVQHLMADLSQANATELATLSVVPIEFPSTDLAGLIRQADYRGLTEVGDVDQCILEADPRRLAQVIDNVVTNSAKYAATRIEVGGAIDGPMLNLTFADRGPGVPEGEAIFARGVRGSNVGDVPGEGLGLFTSAYLMERMGGAIDARNREGGGLAVTVAIPLAGTVGKL